MSKGVVLSFTFATQAGPIPLSDLDTNFGQLAAAVNDFGSYNNYLVDSSGAANTITVTTPANTTFSYVTGQLLQVLLANTNTSATVNINVNSLGNKTVVNQGQTNVGAGQLIAGTILLLQYNGTSFVLLSSGTSGLFASGSAANPSIAFLTYPNTGIYNPGSNTLGFAVAGVSAGIIGNTGGLQWGTPTGGDQGLGTINVQNGYYLNGASQFQSGSFTATLTGMTSTTTGPVYYVISGKIATISCGSLTNLSSANTLTLTGLPAALQPATTAYQLVPCNLYSNGVNTLCGAQINMSSGTITFYVATGSSPTVFSSTGFSPTGYKGLSATSITYSLE